MPPDKFEEEMRCLERIKDKICQCVEVEKEWEKKVKQVLDQVERDHPLLFKVILSILSSVILGLLTSYIWKGFTWIKWRYIVRQMDQNRFIQR